MEGQLIWVVVFCGLTLAFLGILLVASERELKSKRREVEALLAKMESVPDGQGQLGAATAEQDAELASLRASNQELQNQVAGLTGKLELSRRSIEELQAGQPAHAAAEREAEQLQAANERLKIELSELRGRLEASEVRAATTGSQGGGQANFAAQAEMAQLKHQLEASQHKIHEMEIAQHKLPNLDEIESRHRAEHQGLQTRIATLDQELSAAREKVRGLDGLRARAEEAERGQQALRAEIMRHEQELPRWQARIAEAEQHRQRLASLRAPFDDLLAKHVSLTDRQRELQEEIAAFGRLIAAAQITDVNYAPSSATTDMTDDGDKSQSANEQSADQSGSKKARRFGIFPALILFAIGGASLGAWYLSADSVQSNAPAIDTEQSKPRVLARAEIANHSVVQLDTVKPASATAIPKAKTTPLPIAKETPEGVNSAPSAPPAQRATTYEVTRSSRVYAAPSEASQALGDIEPGTKVSVVNNRDGWLEIYSKHGRPPGFIRKDTAARIVAQN